METHPPKVLLAVEPPVLNQALAELLRAAGAVTIDLRDVPPGGGAASYDAALVTVDLPAEVDARVVIELPDEYGNPGAGTVRTHASAGTAQLDGVADLLRLLQDHDVISSPPRR